MSRISPIHYITPSSISITPNANGQADDLAVYIVRGTKIKVYCRKIADLDMRDATYQEWTLTGLNRRLAESAKPYTIYARCSKTDKTAYLVFAPQNLSNGEWVDKYVSVSIDGAGAGYDNYWWVRLGIVSTPKEGSRSVDLDTGILGTELYNNKWVLNPDGLPLRVELSNSKMASTPFVSWGETLTLSSALVQGWDTDAADRIDHWTITRNSGHATSDIAWNAIDRSATFGQTGSITLSHLKGSSDDFDAAVAVSFTVTAWGTAEPMDESSSDNQEIVVLASSTITILAETVERYELAPVTLIASYNPTTETYNPATGIDINIKATAQDGTVFYLTRTQAETAQISVFYNLADAASSDETELEFTGSQSARATVRLPISVFATGRAVDIYLANTAGVELSRQTIAFVRDGEDSLVREWIYLRSATASYGTPPANIEYGEVNPAASASDHNHDKNQDGWVPTGWWNHPQGVTAAYPYEYAAYRDNSLSSSSSSSEDTDTPSWKPFSTPILWSHYGQRGVDGDGVEYVFLRTTNNLAPLLDVTQQGYEADEFRPTITNQTATLAELEQTTDNPKGPTPLYPYEWVAQRSKDTPAADGSRVWMKYRGQLVNGAYDYKMSLWSKWAEDAIALVLESDSGQVLYDGEGTLVGNYPTTIARLFKGRDNIGTQTTWAITPHNCTVSPAHGTVVTDARGHGLQVAIASVSSDSGIYVDISATFENKTYTKRFSVACVRHGSEGQRGPQGQQGPQGEAGQTYRCRWTLGGTEISSLAAAFTGVLKGSLPLTATLMRRLGSGSELAVTATGSTMVVSFVGTPATFTVNDQNPQVSITASDAQYVTTLNSNACRGITVSFTSTAFSGIQTFTIDKVMDGESITGATGAIPIPYGEYNPASTYTRSDDLAPYLWQNNNLGQREYFILKEKGVWKQGDNGTHVWTPEGGSPDNTRGASPYDEVNGTQGQSVWKQVMNLPYLTTEVLMAEMGTIGAWVFWGDYMFSGQGQGAIGAPTDAGGSFIPNLLLDANKGVIKARQGFFGGFVRGMANVVHEHNKSTIAPTIKDIYSAKVEYDGAGTWRVYSQPEETSVVDLSKIGAQTIFYESQPSGDNVLRNVEGYGAIGGVTINLPFYHFTYDYEGLYPLTTRDFITIVADEATAEQAILEADSYIGSTIEITNFGDLGSDSRINIRGLYSGSGRITPHEPYVLPVGTRIRATCKRTEGQAAPTVHTSVYWEIVSIEDNLTRYLNATWNALGIS